MFYNTGKIWGNLVHLGYNMWYEEGNPKAPEEEAATSTLQFDRELWDAYMQYQKDRGVNTLVIDIGEALRYESHPELAVEGSWSHDEMKAELARLNDMGFEVIPKLNFSSAHDIWMKDYSRMLSTPIYYEVCRDLIDEVCTLFKPRYFHIGMDEENWEIQKNYIYSVVRQQDLWWHDLYYLADCVERHNARAWIWSDYIRYHTEEFLAKMPKSIVQSNWYYFMGFESDEEIHQVRTKGYAILDEHGYDQIPAGSSYYDRENMRALTEYCVDRISPEHEIGYCQTYWARLNAANRTKYETAADALGEARKWYESR